MSDDKDKKELVVEPDNAEMAEKIKQDSGKSHMMDVGPGKVAGVLPCGFLDENGKLHDTFIVKEMTGEEEDLLAASGPVSPRIHKMLSNCTEQLGTLSPGVDTVRAVSELTGVDRMLMMIAVRRASLGDHYDVKIPCPYKDGLKVCKNVLNASLNLAKLEVKKMSDPYTRKFENKLKDGTIVKWHILSADDEEWLVKNRKKDENDEDTITLSMIARIDEFGDKILDKEEDTFQAKLFAKRLPVRIRRELRKIMKVDEGTIDTTVDFECPKCGHEWSQELNVATPAFFFPSEE